MDFNFKVKPVVIGRIGKTYGVFGWLRVFSFTEKFNSILDYQPWLIKMTSQRWIQVYLEDSKKYCSSYFIVKLRTIDTRESAKLLSNCEIFIDVSQLPVLNDGEFYWNDLIGCQVIEQNGNSAGVVVDLIETGSNDVLVVKNLKNCVNHTYLIPFIEPQVIQNTDLIARIIRVDWDMS